MSNLSEKDTPNVVICTCDQLRAFELGCYGHEVLQTPNIDRLAKDGTRFEQAVTNCPSCTPARSSLLSGQYSRTCAGTLQNVPLNSRLEEIRIRFRGKTLPEVLQDQGYDTVLCGKWHIHAEPEVLGFNRVLSAATEELRIKAIEEYICNHKGGPFFLYHNIVSPHMPLFETVPERYTDLYTRDEVQLRGNVWRNGKLPHDEWWFRVYLYKDFFRDYHLNNGKIDMQRYSLPKDFDIYDLTALYYGSVIRLDNLVGQLMYILEKNGIAERTIVVFVSDHGDNLGSHHFFNKGRLIEESIRIPMIISYPGRIQQQVNHSHVASIIDIMPTVLELVGCEVPDSVCGRSLASILTGEERQLKNNYAFIETPSGEIGIRTPDHLFGMEFSKREHRIVNEDYCFFDLSRDPYEFENLAVSHRSLHLVSQLRTSLIDWHNNTPWLSVDE